MASSKTIRVDVLIQLALLILFGGIYVSLTKDQVYEAKNYQRNLSHPDVVLPAPASIFLAGGDSHLAGNLLFMRVLVSSTQQMAPETRSAVMELQKQVSVLLPAHEDNYYVAEATLPWMGYVDQTQQILLNAAEARKKDPFPYFYAGFNLQQFKDDYLGAAKLVEKAAVAAPQFKVALQVIAAKWYARTPTPEVAEKALDLLISQAGDPEFKKYLEQQKARNQLVVKLTQSIATYQQRVGHLPTSWDDLMTQQLIEHEPMDPLGARFVIDERGKVRLVNQK
ncbi:hypothetical protein LIN78_11035 [Leeia sp. TBRC 13508]|uniref:Uncharacterized protein n=1 Tax=Leeia speluncae TaxID=2884804 RepID=A0ABS8D7A7_9NEIS|nr:hypothetical protein [Leeia speluncae]MCB6184080.1 hypothetical protein [Leeia speluncae]